tara:strand:+ start:278 stop:454 length:177 start_codon:yes stop_codon:yes gene_type:complete
MKRGWIIAIVLLSILIILIAYPYLANKIVKKHNSKIDYSCEVASDCEVKMVGGDTRLC